MNKSALPRIRPHFFQMKIELDIVKEKQFRLKNIQEVLELKKKINIFNNLCHIDIEFQKLSLIYQNFCKTNSNFGFSQLLVSMFQFFFSRDFFTGCSMCHL